MIFLLDDDNGGGDDNDEEEEEEGLVNKSICLCCSGVGLYGTFFFFFPDDNEVLELVPILFIVGTLDLEFCGVKDIGEEDTDSL